MLKSLTIENAKARDKPYKIADGQGLHLLVNPNGSKLWRLRYRFGGKQKMLALGTFPQVSLAKARARRDDAHTLIESGIDPSQQRKLDKIVAETAARNTFGAIAKEHLQSLEEVGAAPSTIEKQRWLLEDLASPISNRPIAELTPVEILVILKRIEKRGCRETARRLRAVIGRVCRIAVATLRASSDPTYALKDALSPPKVTHRAAITNERKLGALLGALDEYDGSLVVRASLQFLALTMVRPGEVRHMRRNEVIWPKALWRIPAERMKMRRPFDVPLSTQAVAILREIWDLNTGDGLVFPSIRSVLKPLSENAMNAALRRMGYGKEEMCAHGFRSAASTILNERGFDPEVIEVALAHQDSDRIRAVYNRAQYWNERVQLLQAWGDLLDEFKKQAMSRTAA
jgi:integrase